MSYNIDSIDAKLHGARTYARDVVRLLEDLNGPEDCFLYRLQEEATKALYSGRSDAELELRDLNWCGESSGRTFDDFVNDIAPCIRGRVEMIITWEGGYSVNGLLIEDGVVTECDVKMTLVPRLADADLLSATGCKGFATPERSRPKQKR